MKRIAIFFACALLALSAHGQNASATFTGTVLLYGSGFNTRTITRTFTLRLTGQTSEREASRLIGILQDRGQSALLDELDNEKVGTFSIGGQIARDVNAAYVTNVGGKMRIRAVFARWIGFGELRGVIAQWIIRLLTSRSSSTRAPAEGKGLSLRPRRSVSETETATIRSRSRISARFQGSFSVFKCVAGF